MNAMPGMLGMEHTARTMRRIGKFARAAALLVAGMFGTALAQETLFLGGVVWTGSATVPEAEAVHVRDGRIAYVGTNAQAARRAGQDVRKVALNGRMLIPGFVDSHTHPGIAGLLATKLQIVGTRTVADVQSALKAYANANPEEKVIFGFGFPSALNTATNSAGVSGPHRVDLDAVTPDRPVMLLAVDAHSAWLNSRALEVAGITKDTPDPLPGVYYYQRDENNEPTGWLVESGAFWPLLPVFGVGTEADFRAAYATMLPKLSAMGVTTVFDAGIPGDTLLRNAMRALAAMARQGSMPLRYRASAYLPGPGTSGEELAQTITTLRQQFASELLDIHTAKIANDGTIEGETAATLAPYASGGSGAVLLQAKPLGRVLTALRKAGLDAHVHAIGDRALRVALDAVATAREAVPESDARVVAAHAMLATPEDLRRLKALDVMLQTTPHWSHDIAGSLGLYSRLLGKTRGENVMRLRDLWESAPLVAFGSDHPATGLPFEQTAPLYGIEIGHTRRGPGLTTGPRLPPADQRLDLADLLTGYTAAGAKQLRLDDVGEIAAGKRADLVVLSQDPFKTPPHRIHAINVDMTMMGGRVVFERAGR